MTTQILKTTAGSATEPEPATKLVNLALPVDVYNHFSAQAAADDRTLPKHLVRLLKSKHAAEQAAAAKETEKF